MSGDGSVMTKKVNSSENDDLKRSSLSEIKRVTPPVTTPGDTNLSDATVNMQQHCRAYPILLKSFDSPRLN